MTRTDADNLLAPLIADELDASTRADLLSYLATDPDLAAKLADMRAAHTLLQQSAASLTSGPEPRLRFSATRRSQLLTESTRKPPNLRYALFHPTPARLRYVAAAAVILAAISLLGVIFPPLGVSRRTARQMQSNTQLRGIHQGLVTAAQGRDGHYPTDLGELVEGNYITPEYLLSPTDNKQVPANFNQLPPEERRRWARENSSYAFIAPGQKETLDTDRIVAFEKPAEGKKGISIAYDDNHVVHLPTDQARQLIEQQTGHSLEALTTMSERGWTSPPDVSGARQSERFVLADRAKQSGGAANTDAVLSDLVDGVRQQLSNDIVTEDGTGSHIERFAYQTARDNESLDDVASRTQAPQSAAIPDQFRKSSSDYFRPLGNERQTSGGVIFNDSHATLEQAAIPKSGSDEVVDGRRSYEWLGGSKSQWGDTWSSDAVALGDRPAVPPLQVPEPQPQEQVQQLLQEVRESGDRSRSERDGHVQKLLHRAAELRREQKLDQAKDLTDQALFIDPQNVAGQAMKDIIEGGELAVDDRKIVGYTSELAARPDASGFDTTPRPIYESKNNERSGERLQLADAEGKGLPQFTSAPEFDLNGSLSNKGSGGADKPAGTSLFSDRDGEGQPREELDKQIIAMIEDAVDSREMQAESTEEESSRDLNRRGDSIASMRDHSEVKPPPLTPVNPWTLAEQDAQSTFAIDVDTASYDIARRYIGQGFLPPLHTVRMEEFVNEFDYNYSTGCSEPRMFAVHAEAGRSPFGPAGQDVVLLKVGVRGKVIGRDQLKPAHLTFVVDTSGSMDRPDRLPLVKRALQLLMDQLAPADRVSLVTYGTQPSLLLEATPASDRTRIAQTIDALQCQGSTNLSSGVEVGCEIAARHFTAGAVNRVILCSDGVANVGPDAAEQMLARVENFRGQGIGVTTVGFGAGTYNDRMLEQLANQGDGRYLYVGSDADAQRVFVTDMAATLPTIARNVKIQIDFDPSAVRRYRLIGYENRDVADVDFRNDAVKGGEVGSGKTATALYELELNPGSDAALGRVFVRYQDAQTNQFEEVNVPLTSDIIRPRSPQDSPYFHLAACAAELAELLRESEHATSGGGNLSGVSSVLQQVCNVLPRNQQARELLELTQKAQSLPRATQ